MDLKDKPWGIEGKRLGRGAAGRRWMGRQGIYISPDCFAVIPGQPLFRIFCHRLFVFLQGIQVFKRIDSGLDGGLDHTHHDISGLSAEPRFIEERVISVPDGGLEQPFTFVVGERRSRDP